MPDPAQIFADGFTISAKRRGFTDLALLSLRIALRAYFSTYSLVRGRFAVLEGSVSGLSDSQNQEIRDYHHEPAYMEAYSQAVLHFHHFIELTIKELLREEHLLLATDVTHKPLILHKILKSKPLSADEEAQLRSLAFRAALDTLVKLIEARQHRLHRRLRFIKHERPWLDHLNTLRNRIMHRGTFVLRYTALDRVVSQFILPFVEKALKLPLYSSSKFEWRYRRLGCRTDPIRKIIAEGTKARPNAARFALLKELGRAAYNNPLPRGPLRRQRRGIRVLDPAEQQARESALREKKAAGGADIRGCPVCGVKALVIYGDIRSHYMDDEYEPAGIPLPAEFYTYAAKCYCCTFEIEDELRANTFAGLPFKCYWVVAEATITVSKASV